MPTVPVPAPKGNGHLSAPHLRLDPHRTYTVTIVTNCGTFAFALDVAQSPKTSASFYSLVKRRFFDGLTFHRVAAGFVIQGGDPTGTGGGGPGYTVVEAPPRNTQYVLGDVAMAKTADAAGGGVGQPVLHRDRARTPRNPRGSPPTTRCSARSSSGIGVVEKIGSLPTNPPQDGAADAGRRDVERDRLDQLTASAATVRSRSTFRARRTCATCSRFTSSSPGRRRHRRMPTRWTSTACAIRR